MWRVSYAVCCVCVVLCVSRFVRTLEVLNVAAHHDADALDGLVLGDVVLLAHHVVVAHDAHALACVEWKKTRRKCVQRTKWRVCKRCVCV